ncbi:uncharacterized protein [Prorops nasuta]|uniref:uncharacterized protein n=1 Tax=Prorops nasuta TaxID=863751 RepID=UPI0034CF8E3F
MKLLLGFICSLSIVLAVDPLAKPPIGPVSGSTMKSLKGKTIFAFRGVKYGEAPTGHRRFQAASPVSDWQETLDGSREAPSCLRITNRPNSEDCLTLNVYTTKLPSDAENPDVKRPVVVAFPAGNTHSFSAESHYMGPYYLMDQDIVLVTVNYRLATLGFLATGDDAAPGNAGLKDQVMALKWVRRNIAAFGGDPDSVTISGHQSGAEHVILHMLSPMSKGLFHRAIAMSGSPTTPRNLPTHQRNLAFQQGQHLNCNTRDSHALVKCLNKVSSEALRTSILQSIPWNKRRVWFPVVEPEIPGEDSFLTDQPANLIRQGKINAVPLIVGVNGREYLKLVKNIQYSGERANHLPEFNNEWNKIAPTIFEYEEATNRTAEISQELRKYYFGDQPISSSNYDKLLDIFEDSLTIFPVYRLVNLMSMHSSQPVYLYHFTYKGFSERDDLQFLFRIDYRNPTFPTDPNDLDMVDTLTTIYSNFAKYARPLPTNGKFSHVYWEAYSWKDDNYLTIDHNLKISSGFFSERMEKWETLFPLSPLYSYFSKGNDLGYLFQIDYLNVVFPRDASDLDVKHNDIYTVELCRWKFQASKMGCLIFKRGFSNEDDLECQQFRYYRNMCIHTFELCRWKIQAIKLNSLVFVKQQLYLTIDSNLKISNGFSNIRMTEQENLFKNSLDLIASDTGNPRLHSGARETSSYRRYINGAAASENFSKRLELRPRKMEKFILPLLLILAVSLDHLVKADDLLARPPVGKIRGSIIKSRLGKDIFSFRGVRYGQPPIGQLRFAAPRLVRDWKKEFNATVEGPSCPKVGGEIQSEDCLRLNVYTTKMPKNGEVVKRPVVVFFHPGGFYGFSAQSYVFGPQYLLDKDVVLVTVNYRIGMLGFISTGDALAPGNLGLKDQVVALKWIQRNIAAFGGDPNSVTLTGDSAGSWSLTLHMLSPMSKGLFHRAIAMSGSPTTPRLLPTSQRHLLVKQAELLDCPTKTNRQMIDCLRTKPSEDFPNTEKSFREFYGDPILVWSPVVEPNLRGVDRFILEQPVDRLKKGKIHPYPFMIGITKDEFSSIGNMVAESSDVIVPQYNANWTTIAPISFQYERNTPKSLQVSNELRRFYFGGDTITRENARNVGELYADSHVIFPVHRLGKLMGLYSKAPVYFYKFTYQGRYSFAFANDKQPNGVFHQDDLQYVFRIAYHFPPITVNDPESAMIDRLTAIWNSFVYTNEPIPKDDPLFRGVTWEPYRASSENYLDINLNCSMKNGIYPKRMQLWERLFPIEY